MKILLILVAQQSWYPIMICWNSESLFRDCGRRWIQNTIIPTRLGAGEGAISLYPINYWNERFILCSIDFIKMRKSYKSLGNWWINPILSTLSAHAQSPFILLLGFLFSCRSLAPNRMFLTLNGYEYAKDTGAVNPNTTYLIQSNDKLELYICSNDGFD